MRLISYLKIKDFGRKYATSINNPLLIASPKKFIKCFNLEETNKYAVSKFASALVPVLENLQRATGSISEELRAENSQVKNLAEGVEMTLRELLSVFEKFGIKRIDPQGEKFDHNFHQAMQQMEDDSVQPGTVLQVLQAGYTIHDRLLQPALVNVAKASSGDAPKQVDTQA